MSLTEHERHSLDDLAQEIAREDAVLARLLTRGRWLPRRTRVWLTSLAFLKTRAWWQYLLTVGMVAGVAVLGAALGDRRPATFITGMAILVVASVTLCVTQLCRRRSRRRGG